jgi:uncharacterized delta-60 repeat protein
MNAEHRRPGTRRAGRKVSIVLVLLTTTVGAFAASPAVALDPGFGPAGAGVVRIVDPGALHGTNVAALADGSLVTLSGRSSDSGTPVLQRVTSVGSLDASFGDPLTPGRLELTANAGPGDLRVDGSDRVIAAATVSTTGSNGGHAYPTVFRLLGDGTLDPTFKGWLSFDAPGRVSRLVAVDGAIVLTDWSSFRQQACLERLTVSDGSIDTAFGPAATPGRVCLDVAGLTGAFGYGLADGSYALVVPAPGELRVLHVTSLGATIDLRVVPFDSDIVWNLAGRPDGTVVVAALGRDGSFVRRYRADWTPDPTFNAQGATAGTVRFNERVVGMDLRNDGRVLVVGERNRQAIVLLLTSDGRADGALEAGGQQRGAMVLPRGSYASWSPNHSLFEDATTDASGKVVAVGAEDQVDGFTTLASATVIARSEAVGPESPTPSGLLRPMVPTRILDTRPGDDRIGYAGSKPGPGATVLVDVAGRAALPPTGVAAVLMNLTATEASGPGYVTVWPSGAPRPTASNLNIERAGQTLPNLVLAPVGADGRIAIYTQAGTHIVADVVGWFPTGGGLQTLVPERVLDSRASAGPIGYVGPKPVSGQTTALQIAGKAGLPATGVDVAILNVTITESEASGYVSVWPAGMPRPLLSNLNVAGPGRTAQNLVVVPVGTGGAVDLYGQSGGHLVVDLVGWLPVGTGFRPWPQDQARILDTRDGVGAAHNLGAGDTVRVRAALGRSIVVANVTATEAAGPGYVTVWPAGAPRPMASNLNLEAAGQTIPNLVVVATGPDGGFDVFSQSGTGLVADVFGSFPVPPD